MKRYQFSLAISSIAIAVAFIGCGKKHEEETQQTKADQNVVTLTKENLEHVEIKTEPTFQVSAPKDLFATTRAQGSAVTNDGQRFLFNLPAAQTAPAPMTLVLNWTAGLKK